jgi:hypothetical protein
LKRVPHCPGKPHVAHVVKSKEKKMAYVVGYVSAAERAELERRGWDVEDATSYLPEGNDLLGEAPKGLAAVIVWVDNTLFDMMSGPDWEKGPDKEEDPFRPADNWAQCPQCTELLGWNNENGLVGQTCSCGHVFEDK